MKTAQAKAVARSRRGGGYAPPVSNLDDLQAAIGMYFELSAKYGPISLAVNRQVAAEIPDDLEHRRAGVARRKELMTARGADPLAVAIDRLHFRIMARCKAITRSRMPANPTADDFRARALVVLYEAKPTGYAHDGRLEFPDDDGARAVRGLFDAAVAFCGLTEFVAGIERRMMAECRARKGGAA